MNELSKGAGKIFVPDTEAREINMLVRDASCVEQLATHVPMTRLVHNMRKQAEGVEGYWVESMGVKPKDAPTFDSYTLIAKKMAVIIPIEDELRDDADINIATVLRQDVVGEFAEALDRTYMGYEITSPFPDSLSGNTPVANTVPNGTETDLAGDFSLAMATIEANGLEATAAIGHPSLKHMLRNLRDSNRNPIFAENLVNGVMRYSVFGVPTCFTRQVDTDGSPLASELLLFYDRYVKIGDCSGLQVSVSDSATLTQGSEPDINMWEQDMHAFRFVIRKGFVIKDDNALAKITGIPVAAI